MNNLTPEPRADVNGKVTTRWVRSTPANANKALLTAPVPPVREHLKPATAETAPLLTTLMKRVGADDYEGVNVGDLHPLVAHRLEELMTAARGNGPTEFTIFTGDLGLALYAAMDEADLYGPANKSRILHNFAALGGPKGESFQLLLAGLRIRPEFHSVSDFLFELTPEDQKRAAALFKVTCSLDQDHRDVNYSAEDEYGFEYVLPDAEQYVALKNEELADFVLKNPDLADGVINVVNERGSTDVGMLREVLKGEAPAIRSGIL